MYTESYALCSFLQKIVYVFNYRTSGSQLLTTLRTNKIQSNKNGSVFALQQRSKSLSIFFVSTFSKRFVERKARANTERHADEMIAYTRSSHLERFWCVAVN